MRILGVDPGLSRTGWGVLTGDARQVHLQARGVIATDARLAFPERLLEIHNAMEKVIATHRPEIVAVEQSIYARNVQTALKLGHARGVILLAAARQGVEIVEYAPKAIKQSITGNGNASKEQVQRMVAALLQHEHRLQPHDITDAIAVALCHAHRLASPAQSQSR